MSVDPPETSEALRQQLKLPFTFLSDPEGKLLDLLNVRDKGGNPNGVEVAFPTQILVDKEGTVRWVYESGNYRIRARPDQVFAAVADLSPATP